MIGGEFHRPIPRATLRPHQEIEVGQAGDDVVRPQPTASRDDELVGIEIRWNVFAEQFDQLGTLVGLAPDLIHCGGFPSADCFGWTEGSCST